MRDIPASAVTAAVKALCVPANNQLPPDVEAAVRGAYESEPWPIAKQTLGTLCQNLDAARATGLPICQDTGMACVFAEIGQDVHITGGSFEEAVDEGVRQGYTEGYLRKSVVADPIRRGNTGDNTPAVLTVRLVPGDKLRLTLAPKGFGSENMSRLAMLRPSDGEQGVKDFVLDAVRRAEPLSARCSGRGHRRHVRPCGPSCKAGSAAPAGQPPSGPVLCGHGTGAFGKDQRTGHGAAGLRRADHGAWAADRNIPYAHRGPACGGEHQLPRNPSRGGGAVMEYKLTTPLSKADAAKLRAGDTVLLSGPIYTARDAAHKRLCALAAEGKPLPFAIEDAVVYYAGPTPARPGGVIGSVGPTTSYRMDAYAPTLLDMGQTGMIGKGARGPEVVAAMRRTGAVYFAAIGGAGAAIAACVQSAELVCWEDLGSEAVRRLCVRDMPLTVVIDSQGENLYESGPAAYRESLRVR